MNKQAKITVCCLALLIMGHIIYTVDSHRRYLKSVIEESELTRDSALNELRELNLHYDSLLNIIDSLPLGSPLDTLEISSDYGWRRSPINMGWQMHSGTDYLAAWHDTVYATGNGVVSMRRWNAGYGRCIVIDHVPIILTDDIGALTELSELILDKNELTAIPETIGNLQKLKIRI